MVFKITEPCRHCGSIMTLFVLSDLNGKVQVALVHDEFEAPVWHDIKGFEDELKIT